MYRIQCLECGRLSTRVERIFTQECPDCGTTKWIILSPSKFSGWAFLIIGALMIVVPVIISGELSLPPWSTTIILLIGSFLVVNGYAIAMGERV